MTDRKTIDALFEIKAKLAPSGVRVLVVVDSEISETSDWREFYDAETLTRYLADPATFWAKAAGISRDEFLLYCEWRQSQRYAPQCIALTKRGHRCKCTGDYSCIGARDWVELERAGWYCPLHGGESRKSIREREAQLSKERAEIDKRCMTEIVAKVFLDAETSEADVEQIVARYPKGVISNRHAPAYLLWQARQKVRARICTERNAAKQRARYGLGDVRRQT